MSYQSVFKRYEIKYLVTDEQKKMIMREMQKYMYADKYGKSTICNIYFDTPDFLLIRRSLEHPVYKEKLRLRSYGVAKHDSTTFIEIKKKYKRVVYKRRTEMSENESMRYLCNGEHIADSQILREVNYFLEHYKGIAPQVVISYNREAFYSKNDYDFRVTFDDNILWRNYDLSLCKGIYGTPILRNDYSLMEIKTGTAIPLWMTNILSENKIYKTSFSKYGNAYVAIMSERANGGKKSGIFSSTTETIAVPQFLLGIAVALVIGIFLAAVYSYKTKYTKSFVVTLALLPAVVCVVIMMVNGNVGAGVAVAGAFSLVRFRSVPGTAKEIGTIFLAMGAGLICGMGYLGYAVLFSLILGIAMFILNKVNIGADKRLEQDRILKITIPEDLNYTGAFDDLFEKYTVKYETVSVRTANMGSLFKLTYNVTLKNPNDEKDFIDDLRCRNGNLEISMARQEITNNEL